MGPLWDEVCSLVETTMPCLLDFEEFVVSLPFAAGGYENEAGLMRSIRAEGFAL